MIFEKHKIALNSLNNSRSAVLAPFMDIECFELFVSYIGFFGQFFFFFPILQ